MTVNLIRDIYTQYYKTMKIISKIVKLNKTFWIFLYE